VNEARAFRNIIADGDIFILLGYELPTSIVDATSDAWCFYLFNQAGCDGTPAVPEFADGLLPNIVAVTVFSECIGTQCANGLLEFFGRTPRIDHALAGAYFEAGNEIVWADPNTAICISTIDASVFSPEVRECILPTWNTAETDQASQRAEMAERVPLLLRNIENLRSDPINSIVNGENQITTNGRVFATEALGTMPLVIPEAFQAASAGVSSAFATPTGEGALQAQLDQDNLAFVDDWDTIGQFYWGLPGRNVTFILIALLALVAGGGLIWAGERSGNRAAANVAAAVLAITVLAWGMRASGVPVVAFFTFVFVLSLPMAWWVVGKVRS